MSVVARIDVVSTPPLLSRKTGKLVLARTVLVGAKAIIDTVRASYEQRQELLEEAEIARMKKLRKECEQKWPLRDLNYIDCITEQ